MGLKIENSRDSSYILPEKNTASIGDNNGSVKTQNVPVASNKPNKPKLLPITGSVDFTALGCDTERKLARASYMAAAAKAGIASEYAQREFADQMIAGHSSELAILGKKEISLDDAKVKESLNNRSVSFKLSSEEKVELAQFRENYVAAGGKLRYHQTPTIDLREPGVVGSANDSPKATNSKFQVLLNNSGNPTDAKRILAQFAEDRYRGGNLWGQNYRQIGEMSAAQGVKPKITDVKQVGNKFSVEFELTTLDRAKIHENYKNVQAEVNRAVAAYEDFANNNEASSFLRGVFNGALKSVKGTIGLLNLPETMKAVRQVVAHPVETFNALSEELSDTWEEFKNAPANKKSEMVGELVGQAIVEILIGKGIGKAGSILAKTKTGAGILEKAKLMKMATAAKIAETFSDEAAELASQRLSKGLRESFNTSNAAVPGAIIKPELIKDMAVITANKIQNGTVKFSQFSREMLGRFGEQVKPHLEKLFREEMTRLNLGIDEKDLLETKEIWRARRKNEIIEVPPSEEVRNSGWVSRKELREKIYSSEQSTYNNKHTKANTSEDAKKFSLNGEAQYLPQLNTNELEKKAIQEAMRVGNVKKHGQTYYFFHKFDEVVGFDNAKATRWVRVELTSGGIHHGHPMSLERVRKYIPNAEQ